MINADVSGPGRLPLAASNIFRRRFIPSGDVAQPDGSPKDANVVRVAGQSRDEDHRIIPDALRPLGGGIGDRPMTTLAVNFLNGGKRQRNPIMPLAEEFHEGLRSIGNDGWQKDEWRFRYPGIRAKVAEAVRSIRSPAFRTKSRNAFVPVFDLRRSQIGAPSFPQIIEVSPTCRDNSCVVRDHAELMVTA